MLEYQIRIALALASCVLFAAIYAAWHAWKGRNNSASKGDFSGMAPGLVAAAVITVAISGLAFYGRQLYKAWSRDGTGLRPNLPLDLALVSTFVAVWATWATVVRQFPKSVTKDLEKKLAEAEEALAKPASQQRPFRELAASEVQRARLLEDRTMYQARIRADFLYRAGIGFMAASCVPPFVGILLYWYFPPLSKETVDVLVELNTKLAAQFQQPSTLRRPQLEMVLLQSAAKDFVLRLEEFNVPDQLVPRTAGEHEQEGLKDASHAGRILAAMRWSER